MDRRDFLRLSAGAGISAGLGVGSATPAALARNAAAHDAPPAGIPSLDEMAGDWCSGATTLNPPAMDNLRDMIQVRQDLISTRYNPGAGMMPQTATGVPLPVMKIDGREYHSTAMRWFAYELRRRNTNCGGLAVETSVRLMQNKMGFLTRVALHNPSAAERTVAVEITIAQDSALAAGASGNAGVAVNHTLRRGMVSAFVPVHRPTRVTHSAQAVVWRWQLSVPARSTHTLEYVVGMDHAGPAEVIASARDWANHFSALFSACKRLWEQRWSAAFTPGNRFFSGHLPVFETQDAALRRIYYMGVLTVLSCERTDYKVYPVDFLTETDRPGNQYFWDTSMMATVWALLEPRGMKTSLRHWLVCNLMNSHGFNIGNGRDMSPGWYAFSPANVFSTTLTYIRVTGDTGFLDARLADGKTVLQRLAEIALMWKQRATGRQPLANWGGPGNLLEGGDPTYVGCVASLNAQSVGMMREMADVFEMKNDAPRAREFRAAADKLLPAVLGLYVRGQGVWHSVLNNGKRAAQRTCVDFIYVTQAIAADIREPMRGEMLAFVRRELLMKNWMRAMSLRDPGAKRSGRPDHGPMGAYDGWVPLTVGSMCLLGDIAHGVAFLRRTVVSTRQGPYAQAHEFFGPHCLQYDAAVCVATGPTAYGQEVPSRGLKSGAFSSKECICGGAFADVVIGSLFAFRPTIRGAMLADANVARPFEGTLRNLPYRGKLYSLAAGSHGVRVAQQGG